MKKLFTVIATSCIFFSAYAQEAELFKLPKKPYLSIDASLMKGVFSQEFSQVNIITPYGNYLNDNISSITCNNRSYAGLNLSLGYFIDEKHEWAISTGLMYSTKKYDLTVDNFHVEYQSTDYNNDIFRQVISAHGAVVDNIKSTNVSLPIGIKHQINLKGKIGYTFDAGFLFTVSNTNKYASNSTFDYEAIYRYENSGNTIFDPNAVPLATDWLLTKDKLTADQIDQFHQQGYNVGLAVKSGNSGNVNYKSRSVGWYFQPSLTYKMNDNISILFGAFFVKQAFTNDNVSKDYTVTDKLGDYNSLLNAISKTKNFSYGINFGIRYFLTKTPQVSVSTEPVAE